MNEIPDAAIDSAPVLSELWLIRHGESTGNRDRLLQGQEDLPLTDLGHEQARKLAARLGRLDFDALYSSDLARALQTAVHLGEAIHLGTELDARLREIDVGSWSGLSSEQIVERFPEEWRMWQERDPALARGGGESYVCAQLRVVDALEELARRHLGKRIAVVCHGGVMRAYLAHLLGLDLRLIWHLTIGNTGICRIRPFLPTTGGSKPRYGRIDSINDLGHLEMPMARLAGRPAGGTTRLFRKDRS
jgi:broad specificity phosphatase PhoE